MKPFTLKDPGEVAVPGNLGSLGFGLCPEACAPHDSQTEVREQAEEPEWASEP